MRDSAASFDEVAGVDRRREFDEIVGREESLVAVGADQEFGCDVPEEGEDARAVDEVAAVVRLVCAHADP